MNEFIEEWAEGKLTQRVLIVAVVMCFIAGLCFGFLCTDNWHRQQDRKDTVNVSMHCEVQK